MAQAFETRQHVASAHDGSAVWSIAAVPFTVSDAKETPSNTTASSPATSRSSVAVVSGGADGSLRLGNSSLPQSHYMGVSRIACDPQEMVSQDSKTGIFATASLDQRLRLFRVLSRPSAESKPGGDSAADVSECLANLESIATWQTPVLESFDVCIKPRSRGTTLASCGRGGNVSFWDAQATLSQVLASQQREQQQQQLTGKSSSTTTSAAVTLEPAPLPIKVGAVEGCGEFALTLDFSLDGSVLGVGARNGALHLVDTQVVQKSGTLESHTLPLRCVRASTVDPNMFFTGSDDARVTFHDVRSMHRVSTLTGHSEAVLGISVSPNGRLLATAGREGSVKIWDIAQRQLLHTFNEHVGLAWGCAWVDGSTLMSGGGDGVLISYRCRA